jgi:chemotaxis protein CheX
MNIEYINPFIEASQSVLKMMVGIDAQLSKVYLKTSPYMGDSSMIIVGLTGEIRGQAVFCMSKPVALFIASKMMGGMQLEELDEIAKSAISELTNMILGNAATILEKNGLSVEITPPSFVMGDNISISSRKAKIVCIPLAIDPDDPSKILSIDINIAQENDEG